MQSPFPGMDPYLEQSNIWPDVHNRLIFAICDQIQPLLSPRYAAVVTPYVAYEAIDIATTRTMVPDVGVFEQPEPHPATAAVAIAPAPLTGVLDIATRYHRIEIRTVGEEQLITMIELLSPANKRPGAEGADTYERKRRAVLHSAVHLLEIDLLRGGRRPTLVTPLPEESYFILLSRADRRPFVEIWPVSVRAALPVVPVPLREGEADVPLNLTQAVQRIYSSARYDLRINYRNDPPPPALAAEDAAWLAEHLQAAGVRG
ncbi:MAG: DUF4058 family protein [Chloroflexaceae bacterium]|nr:DUF4058 family protein [Chloroflexaceae bacterium]NJO05334.1 DUF4058 family protein [Chloroflexaceae bacterium]